MPANLPPQYFDAEKEFREAKAIPDKIAALEEMLAIMPKHKGTDHLRAELRARIAKLTQAAGKRVTIHRSSTVIPREGAAQIAIIGLPNAGKSQLVARVTKASPMVADYPFTTRTPTPGMMEFENIQLQLIDTPPLAPQAIEVWMAALMRRADALLVLVDLSRDPLAQMEAIVAELAQMRIGIIDQKTEGEPPVVLHRKKALVVGNKIDLPGVAENYAALQKTYGDQLPVLAISAKEGTGLEEMKRGLYQLLDVIRVYTKVPGERADMHEPLVLARGSTIEDAAYSLHKDLLAKLKFARVWGSGKHDGMMAKRGHILQDGDIIELHT